MSPPGNPAPADNGFFHRGGVWVIGQTVLMLLVGALGPTTGAPPESVMTWRGIVAMLLTILGAVFGIGGVWALGRARTIFPRPLEGAQLVRHGVYGVVRHPLYTSLLCLGLAWSLWWGSIPTTLATLMMTIFLVSKARMEEVWLRERFGLEYSEYQKRVHLLIPWIC